MNLLGEIVEIISPDLNVEIVRPKEVCFYIVFPVLMYLFRGTI